MEEIKGISARYTSKAGLKFSVGRVAKMLKMGNYYDRFNMRTAVFLAAVLEYLSTEVLELAGNAAIGNKGTRIMSRHIRVVVKNDSELRKVFGSDTKQDKNNAKPHSSGNSTSKGKGKGKGKGKTRSASHKSLVIQLQNMTL